MHTNDYFGNLQQEGDLVHERYAPFIRDVRSEEDPLPKEKSGNFGRRLNSDERNTLREE